MKQLTRIGAYNESENLDQNAQHNTINSERMSVQRAHRIEQQSTYLLENHFVKGKY